MTTKVGETAMKAVQEREMEKSDFDGLIKGLKEASGFVRTGKLKGGRIHIPSAIDAAAIRAKAGLNQTAFARDIGDTRR